MNKNIIGGIDSEEAQKYLTKLDKMLDRRKNRSIKWVGK